MESVSGLGSAEICSVDLGKTTDKWTKEPTSQWTKAKTKNSKNFEGVKQTVTGLPRVLNGG